MKNRKLIALAILLVAVLAVAGVLYNNLGDDVDTVGLVTVEPTKSDTEAENEQEASENQEEITEAETTETPQYPAPDFTVLDQDGNERKLSEFFGKPIVLNFWASWCGPCQSEMPDFEDAYIQYGNDVHFLMVNCTAGDTMADAKALIAEEGYTFPVYFDTRGEAASLYGASSIPMTFFIDAEGNLVTYARGALSAEWLHTGISYIYPDA